MVNLLIVLCTRSKRGSVDDMSDIHNLGHAICSLVIALSIFTVCLNLFVQTLDNGTRKLYEVAEEYGIELEEPSNTIESVDIQNKAPIVPENNISVKFEVSLVSVSFAGLIPALLLFMKKVSSRLMQKKRKKDIDIPKLQ